MRLFDLHCDTLYSCVHQGQPLAGNTLHIDWERGRRYDDWLQVFAVWTPDTLRGEAAWEQADRILCFAQEQAEAYPQRMRVIHSAGDMADARSHHQCGGILALEGAAALAGDARHIADAARRGVRMITLTWNGENECGYGCSCGPRGGLKPFGRETVRLMETSGIVPDVSHLNEAGFWDVAELTRYPFVASHSVSRAVCNHERNLSDKQFAVIRDRGGLVGLNLCEAQLGEQSFAQIERHLDHYLTLGGERTVGFGCDFDGTDLPPSWGGIEIMADLYDYLCRKNYDESCLERLFFSNCYDFFTRLFTGFDKAAPIR